MNIPVEIAAMFLGGLFALQAWTLKELVNVKTQLAALQQALRMKSENSN